MRGSSLAALHMRVSLEAFHAGLTTKHSTGRTHTRPPLATPHECEAPYSRRRRTSGSLTGLGWLAKDWARRVPEER